MIVLPSPKPIFLCLHCDAVVPADIDKFGTFCSQCQYPLGWGRAEAIDEMDTKAKELGL